MAHNQEKIKHLYLRAGFGLSPGEWEEKKDWTIQRAVSQLINEASSRVKLEERDFYPELDKKKISGLSKEEIAELRIQGRILVAQLGADWIKRMGSVNHPALLERITLFWHDHFACESKMPHLAYNQLKSIRKNALGNFRDLVLAISRDGSMIRYLNNQQNKKKSPNENFARELLELFTIGIGNYTEKDIKEAARAFTGWSSDLKGDFLFRKLQHDYGQKEFMGRTGFFNGEDIIDIILDNKETSRFICGKVYRYFVNEQINESHVAELSNIFFHSGYEIKALLNGLFTAEWFYDPINKGTKIKSPVELMAGMMRTLQIEWQNDQALNLVQKALGQQLFHPPNVAGWPGGKAWIDNATLMTRLNLGTLLFRVGQFQFQVKGEEQKPSRLARKMKASFNLEPIIQLAQNNKKEDAIAALSHYLIAGEMKHDKEIFTAFNHGDDSTVYAQIILRMVSLPEYQMC